MMKNVLPTYKYFDIEPMDGNDCHIIDSTGKEYVDFTSGIGVCNLGYSNEDVKTAVGEQLNHIWHTSNLYINSLQDKVAGKLCPKGYLAFLCNSGTEANEAAFKIARKYTHKKKVLAFNFGFHGRTYGSLSLTGYEAIQSGFTPLVPGSEFAEYNDDKALDFIDNDCAAVILEVIQGEGGVNVGKTKWLNKIEAKCHQTNTLLIVDEVQTGMGRTGYKFAFEYAGLHPDIITCAKGLGNGLPVGAMLAKKELASSFGPGSHGNTFGGNKVVMAAANAVLNQMTPEFLDEVKAKGEFLFQELNTQLLSLPNVEKISGRGLMVGIHLSDSIDVAAVIKKLQSNGMLTISARANTLRLLPPLIMDKKTLQWGVQQIKDVLEKEVASC